MKVKETSTKSKVQDNEEFTLWDHKLVITGLPKGIDIEQIVYDATDNGGRVINDSPLTFRFPECCKRITPVETDNFIYHLEAMVSNLGESK